MNKIRDSGQCIYNNNIRLLLNFIRYYVACLCGYHATTESPMDGTPYEKKGKKTHQFQWWNELQILVSRMILRRGIYELASDGKTIEPYGFYGSHVCSQESHVLQSWEYVNAASLHKMVEWLEFGESLCFRIRAEFLCPWEH